MCCVVSLGGCLFSILACIAQGGDEPTIAELSVPLEDSVSATIKIPGVRPGKLGAVRAPIWDETESIHILFNGFPGAPGITPFGLSRTWMCYATPSKATLEEVRSKKKLASGTSKTGPETRVDFAVFEFTPYEKIPLDQLNAKPLLDSGFKRIEYSPVTFLVSISQKQRSHTVLLIGSPAEKDFDEFARILVDSITLRVDEE